MSGTAVLERPSSVFAAWRVAMESKVPAETVEMLRGMGHDLTFAGDFASVMGGGQAVMQDGGTRVNYGASSPRKDGAAIPEPWS